MAYAIMQALHYTNWKVTRTGIIGHNILIMKGTISFDNQRKSR